MDPPEGDADGGRDKVRLKIRNGYQKSEKLFAANSRARDARCVLLPAGRPSTSSSPTRAAGRRSVVEQPAGALEAIELRVKSVYPGKKYDDSVSPTCSST